MCDQVPTRTQKGLHKSVQPLLAPRRSHQISLPNKSMVKSTEALYLKVSIRYFIKVLEIKI